MANDVRKIESGTIVFLAFQAIFVVVSSICYRALIYRINHFDYGKLHIDEKRIMSAIQDATREFLYSYQTNIENSVDTHVPTTDLITLPGILYSTLRNQLVRIGDVDYGVGDYYKHGSNLWEIVFLDFERQRFYCVGDNGDKLVCCLTGPNSLGDSRNITRPPSRSRASEGGTEDGQLHDPL